MFSKTVVFTLLIIQYGGGHIISDGDSSKLQVEGIVPASRKENLGRPPKHYDWRDHGVVSPVKDQMDCSACWAFSIVANVESQYRLQFGEKVTLSEQFLIDCTLDYAGCKSDASVMKSFTYIVTELGGILQEKDYYPYANRKMSCRWNGLDIRNLQVNNNRTSAVINPDHITHGTVTPHNNVNSENYKKYYLSHKKSKKVKPVIGFRRVRNDEKVMAEFVYKQGPLIAAINSDSMSNYTNGIDEPTEKSCDPKQLNHYVLIVGYNSYVDDNGRETPYWIIKNSWGTEWGDNGFYYLVRGRNACGIATDVTLAFVN